MLMIDRFNPERALDLAASVGLAFALAALIGAERQWRQRSAGLRTNVLVAIGAAAFVTLGEHINGAVGAAQIAAYVVSGVGFLGAGVIMKDGAHVRGLSTAATLWGAAAVGALCGAGLAVEAVLLTLAVLAGNTALRPLVNAINRAPVDEASAEASYELWAVAASADVGEVRDLVVELLERASCPVRDIEVEPRGEDASEIVAHLISTAVEGRVLDSVCAELERSGRVSFASWAAQSGEPG